MNPITHCINIADELLATIDSEGVIQVWNIETAQEIFKLDCGEEQCTFLSYIKANKELICFYNNSSYRLIRIDELNSYTVHKREEIEGMEEDTIIMGGSHQDNFGQQFVFATETGKFFYSDLRSASDRLILGQVKSP